jgi:small subunit ribosomal protein S27e
MKSFANRKNVFFRVKCRCGHEQVVFGAAKTKVRCLSCGSQLVKTTGSKAVFMAKVLEELN